MRGGLQRVMLQEWRGGEGCMGGEREQLEEGAATRSVPAVWVPTFVPTTYELRRRLDEETLKQQQVQRQQKEKGRGGEKKGGAAGGGAGGAAAVVLGAGMAGVGAVAGAIGQGAGAITGLAGGGEEERLVTRGDLLALRGLSDRSLER